MKKKTFKVYLDHPFSPVNTIDKKFYQKLENSFFKNKKFLSVDSKSLEEILTMAKIKKNINFIINLVKIFYLQSLIVFFFCKFIKFYTF